MFLIPGFLIASATFPGVIIHECAHALVCGWTHTRVLEVCYFRFGNPAGYVVHEAPRTAWAHIAIGAGPLLVNTLLGFLIGVIAQFVPDTAPAFWFLLWLGVSVAMYSFPSTGDARNIWRAVWRGDTPIAAKLLGVPLVSLIYLGAVASVFWLHVLYGALVFSAPRYL